ncbi:OmpA family protein [Hymenobacter artigasi]|uniref:Outer membrane protein OmpA-like peptidoglycan-associated protein n=1 Tax=Hymenobacter artigasi TaxID=2719616 RepID=A0ABX1HJC2_9BACT|nr:OmpA family protein [Hymenobacter artigasi]NKI89137.1 outer membrane protein OmpA-like peptidoglycan-associated protein [Hymenobacter artigasi]
MKRSFWCGIGALLLAGPAQAQSLTGVWQGVESETRQPDAYWPSVLRLQESKSGSLFGVLYEEVGTNPGISVTFRMAGKRTGTSFRLEHGEKLNETGRTMLSYWCDGSITFTYDPTLEKLTGHATYKPRGDCSVGTFTLYRIRLKSAATVPAGVETSIRVSGRNVLWYADAELKKPVNSGNTFRTKLNKTTTFYLAQSYYPTRESTVVPITIKVSGTPPRAAKPPLPAPVPAPLPPPDTVRRPSAPLVSATPVVLPTVLFKVGKPELLPESSPALNQLADELKARPTLRIRVLGHADKVGEPDKNQVLSEQRAEAVKTFLVQAGIAPERLRTIGYGDSRPLYPSPDARNRRVEVEEVR